MSDERLSTTAQRSTTWDIVVLLIAFAFPAAIGLIVLTGGGGDVWKEVASARPKIICDIWRRCDLWLDVGVQK